MSESTGIGATVHVVAAGVPETSRTPSAYVLMTFVEVGSVETFSDHGPEGSVEGYTPLKTGVARQLKGGINPGNFTFTCADDPLDPGQIAMIAAANTRRLYPIKVIAADGADSNDTDTVVYFGVRVLSAKANRGGTGVSKRVFVCAIDTPEHEVPSVAVSGGT